MRSTAYITFSTVGILILIIVAVLWALPSSSSDPFIRVGLACTPSISQCRAQAAETFETTDRDGSTMARSGLTDGR